MKNLKKLLPLLLLFSTLFVITATAAEPSNPSEISFDLGKPGIQKETFLNSNGERCTVELVCKENPQTRSSDYILIGDYTYTISLTTILINLSYDLDISQPYIGSAKITKAYNENYLTLGGIVTSDKLTINQSSETSSKAAQATYKTSVQAAGGLGSTTVSLIAKAKSGKLTVSTN